MEKKQRKTVKTAGGKSVRIETINEIVKALRLSLYWEWKGAEESWPYIDEKENPDWGAHIDFIGKMHDYMMNTEDVTEGIILALDHFRNFGDK